MFMIYAPLFTIEKCQNKAHSWRLNAFSLHIICTVFIYFLTSIDVWYEWPGMNIQLNEHLFLNGYTNKDKNFYTHWRALNANIST